MNLSRASSSSSSNARLIPGASSSSSSSSSGRNDAVELARLGPSPPSPRASGRPPSGSGASPKVGPNSPNSSPGNKNSNNNNADRRLSGKAQSGASNVEMERTLQAERVKKRYGYSRIFGDLSSFAISLSASALGPDRVQVGTRKPDAAPEAAAAAAVAGQDGQPDNSLAAQATRFGFRIGGGNTPVGGSNKAAVDKAAAQRAAALGGMESIMAMESGAADEDDANSLTSPSSGSLSSGKPGNGGRRRRGAQRSNGGGGGGGGGEEDDGMEGFDPNDIIGNEDGDNPEVVMWYRRVYREIVRTLLAAVPSLVLFPATAIGFVVEVLQTVLRSIWRDPGNKLRRSGGRVQTALLVFFWPMFILLISLAFTIVFYLGPQVETTSSYVSVSGGVVAFLITTTLPFLFYLFTTGNHHYWNRVPGGLYRSTFRWTFANFRTMLALFFSAIQIVSFPLARLPALYSDAQARFGNTTSTTDPVYQAYLTTVATIEADVEYIVGLFPYFDSFFQFILYLTFGAVIVWIVFLTLPIGEQLTQVWWVDWDALAQYNGRQLDELVVEPADWNTASSSTSGGLGSGSDPSSNPAKKSRLDKLRKLSRTPSALALETGKHSSPNEFDYYVNSDGEQIILPAGTRFIFRFATGRVLGMHLYSRRFHGFLQYLLGDLFYVTITSILLRSFDCTLRCANNVCYAALDSDPGLHCWTTTQHQVWAIMGFLAFIIYLYTASFATPLMSDVLDQRDSLDVRWTPRYDVIDRISQVIILACYILIDVSIPFAPIVVHAIVSLATLVFVERYQPASERTVLLRSSLYQVSMCIALSVLTAYSRITWLPIGLIGASVLLVTIIAIGRYIPLRKQIHTEEITRALTGLGADETMTEQDLLRVRGKERHLLEEAIAKLEKDDYEAAISNFKRAMFHPATFVDAATHLARLTYEGRIIPRKLASCILICRLMIGAAESGTSITPTQKRMFESLLFLSQCDLGLRPTISPGKTYIILENMRHKKDRRMADSYSLIALALLHERRALAGSLNVPEKGYMAVLRPDEREKLAFVCMQEAAKRRTGSVAVLHLARYYVDGIGCAPNVFQALELLTILATKSRFPHVYAYIGMLNMHQAHSAARKGNRMVSQEARKFREDALTAWRAGADLGDPVCRTYLEMIEKQQASTAAALAPALAPAPAPAPASSASGLLGAPSGGDGHGSRRPSNANAANLQAALLSVASANTGGRRLSNAEDMQAAMLAVRGAADKSSASAPPPILASTAWPPQNMAAAGNGAAATASPTTKPAKPTSGYVYVPTTSVANAVLLNKQNFLFQTAVPSNRRAGARAGAPPTVDVTSATSEQQRDRVSVKVPAFMMRTLNVDADAISVGSSDDSGDLSDDDDFDSDDASMA